MSEQVLCFSAKLLDELGKFHGVSVELKKYLPILLELKNLVYIDREQAEHDPNWKQLIPYCMIRSLGQVFVYQRNSKSNEQRLHNLYSLGIGGHINPCDGSDNLTYSRALERELKEEVIINGEFRNTIVGMLYDESNDVGKVHFGIVHRLTLKEPTIQVGVNENKFSNPGFKDIIWLYRNKEKFESWSKLVIENLL